MNTSPKGTCSLMNHMLKKINEKMILKNQQIASVLTSQHVCEVVEMIEEKTIKDRRKYFRPNLDVQYKNVRS